MIRTSSTIIRNGRARARCADQIARNSKTPVCRRTPTITIIPNSRKMTFQSIPVSSEKKMSWPRAAPMADHRGRTDQRDGGPVEPLGDDTTYAWRRRQQAQSTAVRGHGCTSGVATGSPTRLPGTPGGQATRAAAGLAVRSGVVAAVQHVARQPAPDQGLSCPAAVAIAASTRLSVITPW